MHRISPVDTTKMANGKAAPTQSAAKQNLPNRKMRRLQQRAQKRLESLSRQTETETLQPNTASLMESVQQDERPMVQDNSDVTENGQASPDELLQQIQRLKSQLKEQQEQNHTQQVLHEQQMKTHDEEAQNQDYIIKRLKKERSDAFSKLQKKARDAMQNEMDVLNSTNISLRGKLNAEREKVDDLQKKLMNRESPELKSAQTQQEAALSSEKEALCLQVGKLKSDLREQEELSKEAQSSVKQLEDIKRQMRREIVALQSTLSQERGISAILNEAQTRRLDSLLQERNMLCFQVEKLKSDLQEKGESRSSDRRLQDEVTFTEEKPNRKTYKMLQKENSTLYSERAGLRSLVKKHQAMLRDTETALHEAQRKNKILEENAGLKTSEEKSEQTATAQASEQSPTSAQDEAQSSSTALEVSNLRSALQRNNAVLTEAQTKLRTLEEENASLQSSLQNLKTALSKEQRDAEVVRSKVADQEQEIRKQTAKAQTLEQLLNSTKALFKTVVEQCHNKVSAVSSEKDSLEQTVQDLSRETEHLKMEHREELSALQSSVEETRTALQQKIQELSDQMKASEESNSALLTHNHELQEAIRSKDEQILETENRRKKKKKTWFGQCFGR